MVKCPWSEASTKTGKDPNGSNLPTNRTTCPHALKWPGNATLSMRLALLCWLWGLQNTKKADSEDLSRWALSALLNLRFWVFFDTWTAPQHQSHGAPEALSNGHLRKLTSSTARGGGDRRDWLLWITDDKAKRLTNCPTVQLSNWSDELTNWLTYWRTD